MPSRFITKTLLAGLKPLQLDGRPVQDQFETYRELIARRAGQAAADLFAEPIATWRDHDDETGSISWYADTTGDPEPLSSLAPEQRALLEDQLRGTLAALQTALADPRLRPWLLRALVLASPSGILAVGQTVVLTQWGLSAREATTEAELIALAERTVGPYLPATPADVEHDKSTAAAMATVFRGAATRTSPTQPHAHRDQNRSANRDWWFLPAGLAIATIFLCLGLWQGAHLVAARFAARNSSVNLLDETSARAAIDRQREQNSVLEREIEARRRLLSGDVCQLDPARVPRVGLDRLAALAPEVVPLTSSGIRFSGTLADLLKQAVVLVIASGEEGVGTGSGFFITPELIVTNRHVVEEAAKAKIMVTNEKIGVLTAASVVATTSSSAIGGPDLAILRVQNVPFIQPLVLTETIAPLDEVIAAGYPGLLMTADVAFEKMLRGDSSAVPQVILTDGRINAIQPTISGITILPHSAAVSGGNSGGPLVDACGRVVGVNTFIATDREQVVHANYAQRSDGVLAFLRAHGAAAGEVADPCSVRRSTPPPIIPAAAGTAPPAAP